jgi:large subunit ribosomal protein L3
MNNVIFGKKLGMGEAYIGDTRRAITKIQLMPMTISQLKTADKDGYDSAQVAFGKPNRKSSKALLGHLKGSKATAKQTREIAAVDGQAVGSVINPSDVISVGTLVNIQGTSKGKGFAGVMKRWNFSGGPRTHGQSDRARAPGSIGQGTTPGRVLKGKKMAGRMGGDTKTTKNALVVYFDAQTGVAWVTGPVAGAIDSLVRLVTVGTNDKMEAVTYNNATVKPVAEPVVEASVEETVAEETAPEAAPVAEEVVAEPEAAKDEESK